MTDKAKTVATPSDAAAAMHNRAQLPRTLAGGTAAMRAAGKLYLPKNEAETETAYATRLKRSVLFNAFGKTVEDMTGKVFAKPLVLKPNVPDELVTYAEDIDLAGTHINVFACEAFKDGLETGIGYILTDAPVPPEGAKTRADTKAAGIRPYLTYIKVERMLGWKSERIAGVETLVMVRFLECVTEPDPDSEYHDKEIYQVRVIEPTVWRTYRKNDKDEWIENGRGENRLGKITLAPFYASRTGYMTGKPPLEKLAELNVTHWQSASDQRNIIHVARVPILFMAGFTEDDTAVIGASEAITAREPNAKMSYVEHTGAAIGAGREDLKDLEFQMQTMGLQLLVDKPGQTATGEVRDNVKENSPLAMMADSLRDALELSLGFMAEYEGLGVDKGGEIEINKDFGILAGAATDVPQILSAVNAGLLDKATALAELQRRGLIAESVKIEEMLAKAKAEQAAELDAAGTGPFGAAA